MPSFTPVFPPDRGEGGDYAPARPRPHCRFARRRHYGSAGRGVRLAASCLALRWRAYRPQPATLALTRGRRDRPARSIRRVCALAMSSSRLTAKVWNPGHMRSSIPLPVGRTGNWDRWSPTPVERGGVTMDVPVTLGPYPLDACLAGGLEHHRLRAGLCLHRPLCRAAPTR